MSRLEKCNCKPRSTKDCWQPSGAKKKQEYSFLKPSEEAWSYQCLDLGLQASRTVRE